jgi:hypothetical protein
MRCWVTAGKHVNNIRAIAGQLLGKPIPAATDTHPTVELLLDYNNGKVMWEPPWINNPLLGKTYNNT